VVPKLSVWNKLCSY